MASLMIRVFKPDEAEPETKITIPLDVIRTASKLLPKKVAAKLEQEGIDLNEIAALADREEVSGTLIEIEGRNEKVVISIE